MFALIRFSDTFYVVVPPNFPPGYNPPFYKPTQNPL